MGAPRVHAQHALDLVDVAERSVDEHVRGPICYRGKVKFPHEARRGFRHGQGKHPQGKPEREQIGHSDPSLLLSMLARFPITFLGRCRKPSVSNEKPA